MITKIGKHRVKHGDIRDGIDDLMESDIADFVYTDPPWGQGSLRFWQTLNKKDTGQEYRDVIYDDFMDFFFSILAKYSRDKVVVEYGEKWSNDIIALSGRHGFYHNGVCKSLYRSGAKLLTLDMHFLSRSKPFSVSQDIVDDCINKRGFDLVNTLFEKLCPQDAEIILDPLCGMGYTAQATVNRNLSFRGNELNKKRLDKTIARL